MIQETINKFIPGLENQKAKLFPAPFLKEIADFKTIYCLFSGGYHSTTTALQLKDYGFENIVLVHNRTYLEAKYTLELIQKIIYMTDYPYILVEPNTKKMRVGEIFKKSLEKVPEIVEYFRQNKKNYRDLIPCCKLLKKSPSRKFYTKELDKRNSVILSSLCPFESGNRNQWLTELRNKNTFLRLHKKMGNVWYAYPWRDIWSDRPFHNYLLTKGIMPEHSGCIMCPIQIAYSEWKKEREKIPLNIITSYININNNYYKK